MQPRKPFGLRGRPAALERRREKRDPLGVAVSLFSVTQSRVVLMLDVSTGGARISGQSLPETGKDILLKIAETELFGRVIRSDGGEAAIKFEQPIGDAVLEELRQAVSEQTQMAMLHDR